MKGKMLLSSLMLALPGCMLMAQTRDYLAIQTTKTERSVALAGLKKITFGGGQLTAVTTTGDLAFDLAEVKKLYFTDVPSAVERVQANEAMKVAYDKDAECIRIEGNVAEAQLTVYHVNGTQWVSENVEPGGRIVSVSSWPKGIYIVKADGKILKFSK